MYSRKLIVPIIPSRRPSADIVTVLESRFAILERRDVGKRLVNLAIGHIAQNFLLEGQEGNGLLRRLFQREDDLL